MAATLPGLTQALGIMERSLPTTLRIFFRDESIPEISLPLTCEGGDDLYTLGNQEKEVVLPNGEKVLVYAEVASGVAGPDISFSIIQAERDFDVRCNGGLVVSYTTAKGLDVLCQIGTGGWE